MGRGTNRLGYSSPQSSSPLTPGELNDVYTFGQFWIPAGSLTSSDDDPVTIEKYESTSGGTKSPWRTVAKMPPSVLSIAWYNWAFKADFAEDTDAKLLMKSKPIWFAKTTAAGPDNVILIDIDGVNLNIGSSVNNSPGSDTAISQTVPGTAFLMQSGKTADDEAAASMSISGDVISSGDTNLIDMFIERHGELAGDSFDDDIFLLGIMMQWKTNFNNISIWPT